VVVRAILRSIAWTLAILVGTVSVLATLDGGISKTEGLIRLLFSGATVLALLGTGKGGGR
jgi:hypothetical protein